jgi:phosphatidylglycerophosphate synthase
MVSSPKPPSSNSPGSPGSPGWATPANGLTLARLVMAPLCAAAIYNEWTLTAAGLFVAAVISDFADGPLARRRGEASRLGAFFDHATDATFVALGLLALGLRGALPLALPLLVVVAFVQYSIDSRVFARLPLRASALGRANGIAYFVLLGVPLVRDALGLGWPGEGLVRFLAWVLVATTIASMLDRLAALRRARTA